jgi:hypothetical protein
LEQAAASRSKNRWRFLYPASEAFLDTLPQVQYVPHWLDAADLDFFIAEFARTGFTGGLNWYRNMDRSRELLAFLAGAKVVQPSTFIAGEEDLVVAMYRHDFDLLERRKPCSRSRPLGATGEN